MAASFPNAKKTFSAVVNGVTKLVAALFNTPHDEIEAVETFVGPTGGGAQSYSESMTNLLYNYRRGCSCEYKGTADLYVRAGEIMVTDASGNRRLRRNTSDTTVAWTDIDTGSEANSTVYYVYAVADASATTFTVKISANATTPSGCTFFKQIGTFFNNASGNILEVGNLPKTQLGNWVAKATNTVYQAMTDGFVVAYADSSSENSQNNFYGYTDGSTPPTTVRFFQMDYGDQNRSSLAGMMPVRKGDYWKTYSGYGGESVYWISFGL
jgi:hypothetical protein